MRTLGLLAATALLVCSTTDLAHAQNLKKARKTLKQVLLVDGAGSGLDADTVRGLTPTDIQLQLVVALAGSAYSATQTGVVLPGFCTTVDVVCQPGDLLLNCGGMVTLTTGYLTESRQLPGTATCRAGGCGSGGVASLAVTATCINL